MEEKEKKQRPDTEDSLQPQDAEQELHESEKEENQESSSHEESEASSIVTGETTTWNFSKELEAHLQNEQEKQFAFEVKEDSPADEENANDSSTVKESKLEEPVVQTTSHEEENKTEEASETSKDQEEKTEPAVAEKEEEKVEEQKGEKNEPEQQAQGQQKKEHEETVKGLREEQPAEQKQSSKEETEQQQSFFSIRKKIFAAAIALLLVAVGWIGIAFASGNNGHAFGRIFGSSPKQLIFQYGQKTFAFDLEDAGFDGKNPKTVNKQKLNAWIEQIRKQVERPARNANQERLGEPITPEQAGIKLDMEKLNQMLANLNALINKPQKLPVIEIQPKVTTADLKKVDQYLIGSYTTNLGNSNPNRLNNIRLASKAINNLILMPGEKFSFNKVVGERTPERGYKEAGVIIKGEFSEGIGGGICQVSSTLYNSVDEAGLKILQRSSHSAKVTYVPAGRDATVSWGGPDFKFKNNLDKPILIKIHIKHGRITVNIYTVPGTKVHHRDVPRAPGV